MTTSPIITGATAHSVPRRSEDNAASQVLTPGAVAGAAQSVGSAGELYELEVTTPLARIPNHKAAPTLPTHFDPPNFVELGYGTGPRCIECRRNVSACICNVPEPEQEFFKPAVRHDPDGWNRVEF